MTMTVFAQIPNKFNYQAVIRNSDGTLKDPGIVGVVFRIVDSPDGGTVLFEETQDLQVNEFGMFSAMIGATTPLEVSWADGPYFLEVLIDGVPISTSELLSVPYALTAGEVLDKDDADADPQNEIQDLQFVDNVLSITGNTEATPISIPVAGDSQWVLDGDSLSINDKNVGIGTDSPSGKLVVMGDGSETEEEPLFEVKKSDGQTVFAVYNHGAEVLVDENPATGVKGGFAVGGYNSTSSAFTNNYLLVGPDSVRVYVDDNPGKKGIKGGFAVGGYKKDNKAASASFMVLTPDNYFIGHESGKNIESGIYNSTLGYQAGAGLTSGSENIFIGYMSGYQNTGGNQNTFLGYQSGYTNTTGFQNSFIGYKAGYSNTTGQNNLFLGFETGYQNTSGNYNVFMGYRAGAENTTGTGNLFIGEQAGRVNSIGNSNLFIGSGSGFSNVDGNRNLFIGTLAGYDNVSGSSNLFFGEYAGYANTSGFYNIFIGTTAGGSNSTGSRNIFIGDQAGYNNTTGLQNAFIGYQSGYNQIDGNSNTYLGFESGLSGNGSDNVYIGSKAGRTNRGDGNVFIGAGAGGLESSVSNRLIIENTIGVSADNALISGNFDGAGELKFNAHVGISRTALVNNLEVEGSASKTEAGAWLANSDRRIKTEIQDIENAFEVMLKLHPVKFKYTEEYKAAHPSVKDKFYYNFIAQEYEAVFPEEVKSSGEVLGSAQDEILQMDSYNAQIYSIKAVQELIQENQKQKEQIEELYELIRQMQEKE